MIRDRHPRLDIDRWPVREQFIGSCRPRDKKHDRTVMEIYRKEKRRQKLLGNIMEPYRDELEIRRQVTKALWELKGERIRETANPLYRLTKDDRREVAERCEVPFVEGRILMVDREAIVRTPEGREFIVRIDALGKTYSLTQIRRHVAAGCIMNQPTIRIGNGFRARKAEVGKDLVGKIMRSVK